MDLLSSRLDPSLALQWVDLLLVVLAAEAVALALWALRHEVPTALGWHLASGAGLALALRAALAASTTGEFASWLALRRLPRAALWRTGRRPGPGATPRPTTPRRSGADPDASLWALSRPARRRSREYSSESRLQPWWKMCRAACPRAGSRTSPPAV